MENKRATGRGKGAASWAPHAIVGQDSWTGWLGTTSATLCRFGNFMKKEGEKRNSWRGDSWRILLSRHVAEGELGGGGCGLVRLGGGRGGRK